MVATTSRDLPCYFTTGVYIFEKSSHHCMPPVAVVVPKLPVNQRRKNAADRHPLCGIQIQVSGLQGRKSWLFFFSGKIVGEVSDDLNVTYHITLED